MPPPLSHNTVEVYSGFDCLVWIEIAGEDAFHTVARFPTRASCPMNLVPSLVHAMDVRLPASGPPTMTGVVIATAVIYQDAEPAPG